jgi:HlyD family secretion protein
VDIARPSNARQKKIKRAIYAGVALVVVALVTVGLSRLRPAAPTVDAATLWPDTVKRGPMVREVRGLGTLTPEDIRWIPATTAARVESIVLRPGRTVKAGDVILELSNPQLEQQLQDAQLKVQQAEATLANLRVQMANDLLAQRANAAGISAEYNKAKMQLEKDTELFNRGISVSELQLKLEQTDAEGLAIRDQIAKDQLGTHDESTRAQIAVQQSLLDQSRALLALTQRERNELRVRAGIDGVLQVVPVDVGQQVAPGTNLARVANPSRLKAEIKIAETQVKDIQVGQKASIDTRNGIVSGLVTRIDPSVQNGTRTVDVSLSGDLPKGAVADSSVDGTIELERLNDVLYMGRPAFGQEQSTVTVFKVDADGSASRVQVKLGKESVSSVEILSGLSVGDKVILSDMSAWDAFDRIKLK